MQEELRTKAYLSIFKKQRVIIPSKIFGLHRQYAPGQALDDNAFVKVWKTSFENGRWFAYRSVFCYILKKNKRT